MPNLAAVDWMILLVYFFFVLSIGVGLKQFMTGPAQFLLAGRKLPGWLCGLAFAGAGLGSLEILGMGAAGARYGMVSASFFGLGSVVPLLFAALYLVPIYYKSKASSLPGFLHARFDGKTRFVAALLSLAGSVLMAAVSFYLMARVSAGLRLFDVMFHVERIGARWLLVLSVALPAAVVLVFVLLGGLAASMYVQVMQFFVLVAGFLPMVWLGLKQAGGWGGMQKAFAAAAGHGRGLAGGEAMATAVGLGVLFTAGIWCTDFTLLQSALAAENLRAARRAPLLAAAIRALLPFVVVLPGVISASLPTPHTSITVSNQSGNIFHEIDVVPQAVDQGRGLVPAQTDSIGDPMGGNVLHDAAGHAVIDYTMAIPGLLPHNLPTGLLGLGLTALLACLTAGVAARIAAFNTVFIYDIYQPYLHKQASEKHLLAAGRWTALGAVILSAALACGALWVPNMPGVLDLLALSFAVLFAPLLVTFLLGAFWKRATGCGAFAGLLAGMAAALVHWGLTLPAGSARGIAGGWIAVQHRSASILAQNAGTVLCAIVANGIIAAAVSLATAPKPETEVVALAPAAKPSKPVSWWKRPAGVATLILLLAIVVSLIFA